MAPVATSTAASSAAARAARRRKPTAEPAAAPGPAAHDAAAAERGWPGVVADWSGDRQAFRVPWGKAMMWLFLLSDTFVFATFLTGYMTVRVSTTGPWPPPSEVFALQLAGVDVPLLLIAIMTFILISSSGTMALAVNCAWRGEQRVAARLVLVTAALGASFVGLQAYEWSKLIVEEGIRPWGNPLGAAQFGATFFMITGFHGLHVSAGVLLLLWLVRRLGRAGPGPEVGAQVEIVGLYWHFVDLVWVFIFALFYLW